MDRVVPTQGTVQGLTQIQITQTGEPIGGPSSAHSRYQPTTHIDPNTKTITSMAIALELNIIALGKT